MKALYLLQLEWKKYKNYRLFQLLFIGYLILLPGILWSIVGREFGAGVPFDPVTIYTFPDIWEYMAYFGNWLMFFFLGFVGVLTITNEHSYKTFRQNIISGLTRHDFFMAKILSILAIILFCTLYFILVGYVVGSYYTRDPQWDEMTEHAGAIANFALVCLAYSVYGLLLGVLVKRTGFALFIYMVAGMFLEKIFRWLIHKNLFDNVSMHFYPFNSVNDLTPWPSPMIRNAVENSGMRLFLTTGEAQITVWIYILLFLAFIYWRIRKGDL